MSSNLPATRPDEMAILPPGSRQMAQPSKAAAAFLGIEPKTLQEAMDLARLIASSNLCPEQYFNKPGDVLIVGAFAAELGISWLQGLMNTYVVNKRVALFGDIMFALLQQCPDFEYLIDEWDQETGTATCRIKRRGKPERVETFSYRQAEIAGFTEGKNAHTYKKFPKDMLTWKARWRAARPEFSDVFHGMLIVEEARDLHEPGPIVNAPPIREPQALGAVVDGFLGQAKAPAAAGGRAAPSAGPVDESQSTTVEAVDERTYKEKKPPYATKYWWQVKTADGRVMGTFSESARDTAWRALGEGLPVRVVSKPGKQPGTLTLDTIELAIPAGAPAQDASPDDQPPAEGGAPE